MNRIQGSGYLDWAVHGALKTLLGSLLPHKNIAGHHERRKFVAELIARKMMSYRDREGNQQRMTDALLTLNLGTDGSSRRELYSSLIQR